MRGNKNIPNKNNRFIIERLEDLSIDLNICTLSAKVQEIWIKYSGNNYILDNGQMV